jgi:hypothetical protein
MTIKTLNPKGGRPKKYDQARTRKITVHVSPEEAKQIKDKADLMHLSVSSFMREAAIKTRMVAPDPSGPRLLSEIGKIGSNLNQIAKKVNQSGTLSMEEKNGLKRIFERFNEVKRMVKK